MVRTLKLFIFIVLLAGCDIFMNDPAESSSSLILTIGTGNISRSTLIPGEMTFKDYEITLESGSTIIKSGRITDLMYNFSEITPGVWDIKVEGFNVDNALIAEGIKGGFTVTSGFNNSNIELSALQKNQGQVDISLDWSGVALTSKPVNGYSVHLINIETLISSDISENSTFDETSKTLSYSSIIESSDYILIIKLKNGSDTLLSYHEVLKVYQNLNTSNHEILETSDFSSAPAKPENMNVSEDPSGYYITWDDVSILESSYLIERQFADDNWVVITEDLLPNTSAYIDTSANLTKKYKYRVSAVNDFGEGVSTVFETWDTTSPINGALIIGSKTSNSIQLNWTKSTDNQTPRENILYAVYYSDIELNSAALENSGVMSGVFEADITEKDITGLTTGTKYYFTVVSKDQSGNRAYYNVINSIPSYDSAPPRTINLRKHTHNIGNNQARIKWKSRDSESISYYLYYSDTYQTSEEITSFGTLAHTDSSNRQNKKFNKYINNLSAVNNHFALIAEDGAGNRSLSNVVTYPVTGTVFDTNGPSVGELELVSTGDYNISLSWTPAVDNETSRSDLKYRIYYSKDYSIASDIKAYGHEFGNLFSGEIINGKISRNIDDLLYGTRYYFIVEVIDLESNSSLYNVINGETKIPEILPLIKIKNVSPGESSIEVDLDQVVTVYFYDELSASSIEDTTVFITKIDENGDLLDITEQNPLGKQDGTVEYDPDNRAIIFTPAKDENLLVYVDGVLSQVKDEDNNDVKTGYKQKSNYRVNIKSVSSQGGEFIDWSFVFKTFDYQDFRSHWKFDGNGRDYSGKDRHITELTGSFSNSTHKEGSDSVYLDGSDTGVIQNLSLGDTFTVTSWVYMDFPINYSLNTIISNTVGLESSNGFKLCVNTWNKSDQTITVELGNGTTGCKFYTGDSFVKEGGWYHLAFVIDKSTHTIKLFFDGEEPVWPDGSIGVKFTSQDGDGSRTEQDFIDDGGWNFKTSGPFTFGSFPEGTDPGRVSYGFKGLIDDMRIYNRILSDNDIKQIATQNY